MIYIWATSLVLVNLVWLALNLVSLPGNWLMVATAILVAWINWDHGMIGVPVLVAICILALIGEVLESLAGVAGARTAGASRAGTWGALGGSLVGGLVGTIAIPVPIVGSLIGACGGACLGALIMELASKRSMRSSIKSGIGGGAGRLAGTLCKLAVGAVIWLITAIAAFWG